MLLSAYIISCLLLVLAAERLRVIPRSLMLLSEMRGAFAIVGSKTMSDDEKEVAIRKASVRLMGAILLLSAALGIVFAAAAAPVWLGDMQGWFTVEQFLFYTIEPVVILATIAVASVSALARRFARTA